MAVNNSQKEFSLKQKIELKGNLPVFSWCKDIDEGTYKQILDLSRHPALFRHIAIMPDAHLGFGIPIGAVIASQNAVIPNAVGVDIGCGMNALRTTLPIENAIDKSKLRCLISSIKAQVPVGEGNSRSQGLFWEGFEKWKDDMKGQKFPSWFTKDSEELDKKNLGTLGGGNHFIEIQAGSDGYVWIMLHSGSRNLGYRIANTYQNIALALDERLGLSFPNADLAWLPIGSAEAKSYIRDMEYALTYAAQNRLSMMGYIKKAFNSLYPSCGFEEEINIHHNYAALEMHFGQELWVHRKGAISAMLGQKGIIPGSMGTISYIVEGLGNKNSYKSSSHGAGRKMSRNEAIRILNQADCDKAMKGIVIEDWKYSRLKGPSGKKLPDLSEAPDAYKNIDDVMNAQADLTRILITLKPLAVLKG